MRRRQFITLLGGAAAWPAVTRAQQSERMRRIAVPMNRATNNSEGQARLAAFRQALQELGWSEGRNVQMDIRYGEDNIDLERKYAAELVALSPNIVVASGTVSVTALQPISKNVPVVFAVVTYPVGVGFVDNLAHPGGNVTGFMIYEYSLPGKWLEFLKQIAPAVTQVIVFRDPTNPSGIACRAVPTRLSTALPARTSFRGSLDGGSVEPISS